MAGCKDVCGRRGMGAGSKNAAALLTKWFPFTQNSIQLTDEELSMTNSSRVSRIGLLVFGILILASACWAQTCPPAVEKVAKAYGIDSWGKVEAIRYTFNIDV